MLVSLQRRPSSQRGSQLRVPFGSRPIRRTVQSSTLDARSSMRSGVQWEIKGRAYDRVLLLDGAMVYRQRIF